MFQTKLLNETLDKAIIRFETLKTYRWSLKVITKTTPSATITQPFHNNHVDICSLCPSSLCARRPPSYAHACRKPILYCAVSFLFFCTQFFIPSNMCMLYVFFKYFVQQHMLNLSVILYFVLLNNFKQIQFVFSCIVSI